MKQTIISLILGLMLVFALTACSREQAPDVTPTPSGSSAPDGDGHYSVEDDGMVTDKEPGHDGGISDIAPDHTGSGTDQNSSGTIHDNADSAVDDAGNAIGGAMDDTGNAVSDLIRGAENALRGIGDNVSRALH